MQKFRNIRQIRRPLLHVWQSGPILHAILRNIRRFWLLTRISFETSVTSRKHVRDIRSKSHLTGQKLETFVKNLIKTGQNSKHSQNPLFWLQIWAEKNEPKKWQKRKAKSYSTVTKAPPHTRYFRVSKAAFYPRSKNHALEPSLVTTPPGFT